MSLKPLQSNEEEESSLAMPRHLHPTDAPFVQKRMEWLPDWRDQSQYPPTHALNARLAWELLRRNRFFQKDCLVASKTAEERRALCQRWGLGSFKPFWESFSGKDQIFAIPETYSAGNHEIALVQAAKLLSPQKLTLELDLQNMSNSNADRLRQFKQLRELVESYLLPTQGELRTVPAQVWPTKVSRYLRVADALSQLHPDTRQAIGARFHREGLILIQHRCAWTEQEVIAKAKTAFATYETEGVNELLNAEFKIQATRQKALHKKYSREVGALIARAYGVIYGGGYKLLAFMPQESQRKAVRYIPTKYKPTDDGLFQNTKLWPNRKSGWS